MKWKNYYQPNTIYGKARYAVWKEQAFCEGWNVSVNTLRSIPETTVLS